MLHTIVPDGSFVDKSKVFTYEKIFASDVTEEDMKAKILAYLKDPSVRICLNYHMMTAG